MIHFTSLNNSLLDTTFVKTDSDTSDKFHNRTQDTSLFTLNLDVIVVER